MCLSILAEEEVYQPVDYETRVSLTGVLAPHDHDDGLVGSAYLDEGDVYSSDWFSNRCESSERDW